MTGPFKPSEDGERLVSQDGKRSIEPTPGLFFADSDPMLSLDNSGVSCETVTQFYRAVRLKAPIKAEGVQFTQTSFYMHGFQHSFFNRTKTEKTEKEFPAGTLLVSTFGASASQGSEWYALSPNQQKYQNLARVFFRAGQEDRVLSRNVGASCSNIHRVSVLRGTVKEWPHEPSVQKRAHHADIDLMIQLKLLKI